MLKLSNSRKSSLTSDQIADTYDAVIHIGAPKAGSSYLQHFLLSNRSRLKQAGYYYPEHGADPNLVSAGHWEIGIALKAGDYQKASQTYQHYLRQAKRKGLALLLSSEAFYIHPEEMGAITGRKRVRIVAFFRDPVDAVYSIYNQIVKRHFGAKPFSVFSKNLISTDRENVSGLIFDKWADTFGKERFKVLPYDRSLFKKKPIEQVFLDELAVSNQQGFSAVRKNINTAYSPSALELKRLINGVLDKDNKRLNNKIDFCLQYFSDSHQESQVSLAAMLGSEGYRSLVDRFAASTAHILDEYLSGYRGAWPQSDNCSQESEIARTGRTLSLEYVAREAFENEPEIYKYILGRIKLTLSNSQNAVPYDLVRLAEVFGLKQNQQASVCRCFDAKAHSVFVSEKCSSADYLREIALVYEREGMYENALAVIKRALQLRPDGPVIQKIFNRLQSRLDS